MHDKRSIYSLNKQDPEAIVYTDADKHTIRLTREDFDTEADFLKWKAWSDEDYHNEEKGDHVEDNHTTPLDERAGASDGPEVIIERRIEKQAQEQYTTETVIRIKGQLTEKQFRRLWLNCVEGLSKEEIAKLEGRSHQGISKSINAAMKKILRFFLF